MLGMAVHVVPSSETTTFHNTYLRGKRTQHLKEVAGPITPADVPRAWRSCPTVLLGPVADEISYDLARHFQDSLVVASIQGWLRRWDSAGLMEPKHWDGQAVLPYVDAVVVSIEDVRDDTLIDLWAEITPVLILTLGEDGARLHYQGVWHHIAAFPVDEVDPTGAGDVFAAAYLARYRETADPLELARFASCAASFCVEADGVAGIPTLAQVEARLKTSSQ
jgi:sugar/nucleoside kinase (ribokinase family)